MFTSVCLEVLGCYHDNKADGILVLEHLVGPPPDGSHAFDGRDAIVGDENLLTNTAALWEMKHSVLPCISHTCRSDVITTAGRLFGSR